MWVSSCDRPWRATASRPATGSTAKAGYRRHPRESKRGAQSKGGIRGELPKQELELVRVEVDESAQFADLKVPWTTTSSLRLQEVLVKTGAPRSMFFRAQAR